MEHLAFEANLIEAGDARNVDQRAGRADLALDLEQEVGAACDEARIRLMSREQGKRLVQIIWRIVSLPHYFTFVFGQA